MFNEIPMLLHSNVGESLGHYLLTEASHISAVDVQTITHQDLSGVLNVALSNESDDGSLDDPFAPNLFVFPNITFVLVVQPKWKSTDFPIFKHF